MLCSRVGSDTPAVYRLPNFSPDVSTGCQPSIAIPPCVGCRCCSLVAVIVAVHGLCGGNALKGSQVRDCERRLVVDWCVEVGLRCSGVRVENLSGSCQGSAARRGLEVALLHVDADVALLEESCNPCSRAPGASVGEGIVRASRLAATSL
jgi:hypothetical protein